jgi:serine/threonine protein phosphatase PrpC
MIFTSCSACGASVREGELFCEACGHSVASPPIESSALRAVPSSPIESSALPAANSVATAPAGARRQACVRCGAPAEEITEDQYCGRCGMRQPRYGDHRESDLGEVAAASTDRGLRHHQNEDTYEIECRDDRIVAVLCDGVSSSTTPELAAAAAAAAALQALSPALEGPCPDHDAARDLLNDAIARAQLAVAGLAADGGPQAPATTVVAAIVTEGVVALANVGDSRAYWLAEEPGEISRPLTVDDSCAQQAIAMGVEPAQAYSAEDAHTLTRWLGADAGEIVPTVSVLESPRHGTVLLCSDGLWNHFPEADQLLDLLAGDGDPRPIAAARRMVTAALSAGGEDNITAIVIPAPFRPNPSPDPQEFSHADLHP